MKVREYFIMVRIDSKLWRCLKNDFDHVLKNKFISNGGGLYTEEFHLLFNEELINNQKVF